MTAFRTSIPGLDVQELDGRLTQWAPTALAPRVVDVDQLPDDRHKARQLRAVQAAPAVVQPPAAAPAFDLKPIVDTRMAEFQPSALRPAAGHGIRAAQARRERPPVLWLLAAATAGAAVATAFLMPH